MKKINNSTANTTLTTAQAVWLAKLTAQSLGVHVGSNGSACRCGQCRHRIVAAARAQGIQASAIAGRVWKPVAVEATRVVARPRLTGSVASTATVFVGGRRMNGVEAIVALSQAHA